MEVFLWPSNYSYILNITIFLEVIQKSSDMTLEIVRLPSNVASLKSLQSTERLRLLCRRGFFQTVIEAEFPVKIDGTIIVVGKVLNI